MSDLFEVIQKNNILISIGTIFILSLLGSTHCLVMCVPFASIFNKKQLVRYHLGRLVSYLVIGSILFLFTQSLLDTPLFQISAGFLFLGYFIYSTVRSHKSCNLVKSNKQSALKMGLINGILPCSWLYLSLYIISLRDSTAFYYIGLFVFWLGTVPIFSILNYKHFFVRHIPILKNKEFKLSVYVVMCLFSFVLHFKSNANPSQKPQDLICLPSLLK